jgi:putative endonuclease
VKNRQGVLGEEVATYFLEDRGYRILERNFRCRFGEVDLIAERDEYLCFVEVKLRGDGALARPAEWVTAEKQRKLIKTAEYYIARQRETGKQPRFDCIEVYTDAGRLPCGLNMIKNAF